MLSETTFHLECVLNGRPVSSMPASNIGIRLVPFRPHALTVENFELPGWVQAGLGSPQRAEATSPFPIHWLLVVVIDWLSPEP
eukprot:12192306-Alexandrium_andersonii.AAC.1